MGRPGQPVLVAGRPLLVGAAFEDIVLDELLQAVGEYVPGRTGPLQEVLEAPRAQKGLAQDE